MGKIKDLTGQHFGKLTVLEKADNIGKKTAWLCECDCLDENNNQFYILMKNIKN